MFILSNYLTFCVFLESFIISKENKQNSKGNQKYLQRGVATLQNSFLSNTTFIVDLFCFGKNLKLNIHVGLFSEYK